MRFVERWPLPRGAHVLSVLTTNGADRRYQVSDRFCMAQRSGCCQRLGARLKRSSAWQDALAIEGIWVRRTFLRQHCLVSLGQISPRILVVEAGQCTKTE